MKIFKKVNPFLILIILLAFVLRFWQLDKIPSGFHSDEAAFGYNAYSIIQTGKDEYGEFLPLILKSFGDYKGAVYAYLTIPSILAFGLSEFAVRLPTAIFGVLFVALSYLLAFQLTKSKRIAIITALLCTINPLSIFLSRVQSDPLVSVVFILLGLYLFLLWIEGKRNSYIFFAGASWVISLFTYPSPRVFLPIIIIIILLFYGKTLIRQKRYIFIPIFILILALNVSFYFGPSSSRFRQLSVFNTETVKLVLEEKIREEGPQLPLVTRFFHNKPVDYSLFFIKNYFDYFSFDFLFLKGGQPDRESVPAAGLFYLIELPLFFFGAYLLIKKKENWGLFSILSIVLLPLGLALAVDESPNVHRFFLLVFFIELVVAFGLVKFYYELRNRRYLKFLPVILALILTYNIFYFLHQLFVHQPVHRPWYRGFAYKSLAESLNEQYPKYKKIIITKVHASPYIYILFYTKYDPKTYQAEGSPRDLIENRGFGKYAFTSLDCPLVLKEKEKKIRGETGILYVNRGTCSISKENAKLLKTIKWNDETNAFQLLEYVP